MNGWNRLFVVVAVVWTLVAPFVFVSESNKPADAIYSACSHIVYERYGTGSSPTVDMDRYRTEGAKCLDTRWTSIQNLLQTQISHERKA